jgi:hypothetical protein
VEVTVEQDDDKKKGHAFTFELAAYIEAKTILGRGASETIRPVFMVAAMSEAKASAVRANLIMGRRFGVLNNHNKWGTRFEMMRSQPYVWEAQRAEGGYLLTAYVAQPFLPDPGFVDHDRLTFVMLPQLSWVARMAEKLGPIAMGKACAYVSKVLPPKRRYDDVDVEPESVVAMAPLFAAYLDRRTRVPLVPDLRFQLQMLVHMLRIRAAVRPDDTSRSELRSQGLEPLGFGEPVMVDTTHKVFEEFAAEESARFLKATGGVSSRV